MEGRLFLSGGGNEKQTEALDEIFLKDIKKILYIPLAWPNNDFDSCLKWLTSLIDQHKKRETEIDMIIDLNKEINLENYDAVYIGGGNTFKLLKKIRESNFDKKLIDYYKKGGTIYGGSAGAIIFGKDINIALICKDRDVNNVNLKDTGGLNLLNGAYIQCHFEEDQIDEHKKFIDENNAKEIICIPEESALMITAQGAQAIGLKPIIIISKQEVKRYEVKEQITL